MFSFLRTKADLDHVQVVVIVSTGRTGTRFLANLFNRPDLGLIAKHEPPPALTDVANGFAKGILSFEQARKQTLKARNEILKQIKDSIYIESNSGLILLLPVLKHLIGKLKVVHVVRNPLDFVISGVNRVVHRDGELVQAYAKDESWQLRATDFPDSREDWAAMDIYERFMWTWQLKNGRAREFILKNPGCGMTVRFEDIFHSQNREGFEAILDFLNLRKLSPHFDREEFEHVINASKAALNQPYQDWPTRRKESLCRICGDLARVWNYDLQPKCEA